MVPDSDMVPIPGMAESLATFLTKPEQRDCEKCAYVVPVYEIKSTIGQGEYYALYKLTDILSSFHLVSLRHLVILSSYHLVILSSCPLVVC